MNCTAPKGQGREPQAPQGLEEWTMVPQRKIEELFSKDGTWMLGKQNPVLPLDPSARSCAVAVEGPSQVLL